MSPWKTTAQTSLFTRLAGGFRSSPTLQNSKLKERSDNWLDSFAKTGSPENEYLPDWKPYTKGNEVTMIIDRNSEPRVNYDKELLAYHRELQIEIARPNMLM